MRTYTHVRMHNSILYAEICLLVKEKFIIMYLMKHKYNQIKLIYQINRSSF